MPEKPRVGRKDEAAGLSGGRPNREGNHYSQADLKQRLGEAEQELEKAKKIQRSLARNCNRAEQDLRRREEIFALAREHGSDLVLRLSRDGAVLEVSPACREMLGHDPRALERRPLQDLVAEEDHETLRRFLHSVQRGSHEGVILRLLHQQQGPRPVQIHCRAVPHPQTQALEIIALGRALGPAPPESPLEYLADSLAHELNQPLTALAIAARACSQLARSGRIEADELTQAIDQMAVQAERAAELVRRMRQLAGGGQPCRAPLDAADLVKGVLDLLASDLSREGISIQLHLDADLSKMSVDRIQMEQVLVNLIRNAIDAMSALPVERRKLTVSVACVNSEIVIRVADTGPGLSPTMAERLFQPYQTTKPQGMGLGLALSMAIVQAHSGRLWVAPGQGLGTTLCIALPSGT